MDEISFIEAFQPHKTYNFFYDFTDFWWNFFNSLSFFEKNKFKKLIIKILKLFFLLFTFLFKVKYQFSVWVVNFFLPFQLFFITNSLFFSNKHYQLELLKS